MGRVRYGVQSVVGTRCGGAVTLSLPLFICIAVREAQVEREREREKESSVHIHSCKINTGRGVEFPNGNDNYGCRGPSACFLYQQSRAAWHIM